MAVHIGIGFKSRMKNTASKKKTCLGFLLIVFLAYVVCYLLSQTVFHEIYLFEWTAAHYYLCVWVASVTFCFLEMYKAALITTAGNWAGILIGQVLGDFIIKIFYLGNMERQIHTTYLQIFRLILKHMKKYIICMSIIRMNGLIKQLLIQQNPDIFHQTERLNNIMKKSGI